MYEVRSDFIGGQITTTSAPVWIYYCKRGQLELFTPNDAASRTSKLCCYSAAPFPSVHQFIAPMEIPSSPLTFVSCHQQSSWLNKFNVIYRKGQNMLEQCSQLLFLEVVSEVHTFDVWCSSIFYFIWHNALDAECLQTTFNQIATPHNKYQRCRSVLLTESTHIKLFFVFHSYIFFFCTFWVNLQLVWTTFTVPFTLKSWVFSYQNQRSSFSYLLLHWNTSLSWPYSTRDKLYHPHHVTEERHQLHSYL